MSYAEMLLNARKMIEELGQDGVAKYATLGRMCQCKMCVLCAVHQTLYGKRSNGDKTNQPTLLERLLLERSMDQVNGCGHPLRMARRRPPVPAD